jgi:hypothetical protein
MFILSGYLYCTAVLLGEERITIARADESKCHGACLVMKLISPFFQSESWRALYKFNNILTFETSSLNDMTHYVTESNVVMTGQESVVVLKCKLLPFYLDDSTKD